MAQKKRKDSQEAWLWWSLLVRYTLRFFQQYHHLLLITSRLRLSLGHLLVKWIQSGSTSLTLLRCMPQIVVKLPARAGLRKAEVFVEKAQELTSQLIWTMQNVGIGYFIKDVTPLPHNGCRLQRQNI